jgi:hypothetical protein
MRVHYSDRADTVTRYGMTSMAQVILAIHDDESSVVGYSLEGRDY